MPNKPKLGSGERFKKMENKLEKKGYSKESATKIAASIGRKKYGDEKMQKMAAAGKKKYGGKMKCGGKMKSK